MQCEEFEQRWQECLDERRAPESDEALLGHASGCAACGEMLRACDALMDGLDLLVLPDPPECLTQRVLADAVPRSATSSKRASLRSRVAAGALAACMLIATAVAIYQISRPDGETLDPEKPGIAGKAPPARTRTKKKGKDGILGPRAEENLLAFTTRRAKEIWRNADVAENPPEWLDPMSRPLIPVKDSVTAAFHAMRNALPQQSRQPDKSRSS